MPPDSPPSGKRLLLVYHISGKNASVFAKKIAQAPKESPRQGCFFCET
jgi:hypothetical protein